MSDMQTEEPAKAETPNLPRPVQPRNPMRFQINGVQDTSAALKETIQGSELHAGLKAYLCDTIDELKASAVEVHLHDSEHLDNQQQVYGVSLSVTVKKRDLGAGRGKIFKRAI